MREHVRKEYQGLGKRDRYMYALWGFPIIVLSSVLMAPISKLGIRESFLPSREWMHLGNCFLLHLPWWMQKTTTIGYGCLNFSAVFLNKPHPSSLNLRYRLKYWYAYHPFWPHNTASTKLI